MKHILQNFALKKGILRMDDKETRVHVTHCCLIHGCKYGDDEDCPVASGKMEQFYICEDCGNNGIESVEYIKRYKEGKLNICPKCGNVLRRRIKKIERSLYEYAGLYLVNTKKIGNDKCIDWVAVENIKEARSIWNGSKPKSYKHIHNTLRDLRRLIDA